MTGFHEVQFPPDISYGAVGGPAYSTTIVATVSGREQRNVNWAQARGRWNVAHGLKKREQVAALIAFFRARQGRAYGFRFKDWTDYQLGSANAPQPIGLGDAANRLFQLYKRYSSGGVDHDRLIVKPVAGTVRVFEDGVERTTGWTVDITTGLITFAVAPAAGHIIAAACEFDVPARFDTDQMDITIETYQLGTWGQIPVVEIRL
ncbi:MAG: DUF2460 domain-containing protein [Rhodospirillaceae bacterium]|nr:DUF2460 domain-containing protein [Rhodospirillaceae bacterium]